MGVLLFLGCLYSLSAQEVINVAVEPLEQRNLPSVAVEDDFKIPNEEYAQPSEPENIPSTEVANESGLTLFQFESQSVHFLKVDGRDAVVGVDVARVLGYTDPSKAVSLNVDAQNKGITKLVTPGGTQSVAVLFEPGIYQLIFGSKLPLSKKIQQWIFEEVLPTIRKTGTYSVTPEPSQPPETEKRRLAAPIVPDSWRCYFTTFVYAPNACEIFLQWTTCSLKRPSVKVAKCRPYFSAMLVCPVELSR